MRNPNCMERRIVMTSWKCRTAWLCLAACLISGGASGTEFYVSPDGNGPGTREAPASIELLSNPGERVVPGDTIWMLGGLYVVPPTDKLRPVEHIVSPLFPGKQAKRSELICELTGTRDRPVIVRQAPGQRVTIEGGLQIHGENTWFWGLEVRGTRGTDREEVNSRVSVFGPGTKLINMVLHRGQTGIGCWWPAIDSELYGNVMYDCGWDQGGRGYGSAAMIHNEYGTKRVVDNVMFAAHAHNIEVYRLNKNSESSGYHIEGNILFSPGMASSPADAPHDNVFIYAYQPMDRVELIGNIAYHPRTGGWRYNVRLGPFGGTFHHAAAIRDNYFMGYNGVGLHKWRKIEMTGNEIWAPQHLLTYEKPSDKSDVDWTINHNHYHALPEELKFNGKTFAAHQKESGLDADSTLEPTVNGRPTGTRIFVRPNQYEPGRANIAVFNWDGKDAVEVDLSSVGLKEGQMFQVRNVLDLYGKPVAEGSWNGKPVRLPMLKSAIAPDFDAFLVVPKESFGCFQARGDELPSDWQKQDWGKPGALDWKEK
ncbi:MAG: hypothetical protein WCH98_12045 [Verrucomicrobiota bacterium]